MSLKEPIVSMKMTNKQQLVISQKAFTFIAILTTSSLLSGCGFVTAPTQLLTAEIASSTVTLVDKGIESAQKSATYAGEKGLKAAQNAEAFAIRVLARPTQPAQE